MKYCVDFKVCDQQQLLSPSRKTNDAVQFILAFTSQISADIVSKELKNLILKVHTTIQPVYVSRKTERELNMKETKPPIVNQQCVVHRFQCDLCDSGYVSYTHVDLHNRVKERHKEKSPAISRHYKTAHETMPQDPLKRFEVLDKGKNKLDCLHEMLFIRASKANLIMQSDSICAKVFL